MDGITVGPLQLCNILVAQPGIGLGIKVKNEINITYKSIRYDEIIILGISEFVSRVAHCPTSEGTYTVNFS